MTRVDIPDTVFQTARRPNLLRVNEVAQILRVSTRTVRRWAQSGRLERIELSPTKIHYTTRSVEALIDAGAES